ncbi:excisionase family DNA-binding protein [Cellulomonas sp. Root137]|uniref:excisionase family DNA-binding protein n=1 Tax=Cellulomonas sp. Root137 TaxID=1736459 RepID=UPI0009EBF44C|nr:excisionase family DNA-binding protein [Cellulomonas sp. Root137]
MSASTREAQRPEFVSVAEVAAELQVTDRFVRRLIADGELRAVRVGSRLVRIRRGDLEAILRPVVGPRVDAR